MQKRDYSLDLLKGIACIFMVFSHAAIDTRNAVLIGLGFLGSFAAVLFFSVTGVTAWMQAGRRSPKEILSSYTILFLAGFSLNGIIHIDFYKDFEVEMLQIIALGATLIYFIQYLKHPRPLTYLLVGIFVFLIKEIFDLLTANTLPTPIIDVSLLRGWLIPPGTFTPIPWLFVFFFAVYAYQISARKNLILASLSIMGILGILLITRDPGRIDLVNKWDMSIGYFLFSCFCLFFCYYLIKRFVFNKETILSQYVLFLGRNSLLFLYVHIFFINILFRLGAAKLIWLYWPLVLLLSSITIYFFLIFYPKLNLSRYFHSKISWLILILIVLLTPLIFKDPFTIFLLEFFWGVIFSTNYAESKNLFRSTQIVLTDQTEKPVGD